MSEYKVYQLIFFRDKLGIFVEHGNGGGGGELFSFRGTGEEPRCEIEDVESSPFADPKFAGSKLLGTMNPDDVERAWKLCREYVEDEGNNHEDVTGWCVEAAALLAREKLVVVKPWWTIADVKKEEEVEQISGESRLL
ncbi:hypothetical protein NLG97_g6702 [Lecanicillium saksenae]|uniref:Uncharacterized protein n=1 Tax=Lecanicillium saksenae TaxID=468837 RepID=A0ACC1QQI6_9HYPO|nr:hypothetical protein NLG97_g6702 [Lecanicillium saksenae]